MNKSKQLKVAITHDFLYEFGGAEQVLWQLIKIFPRADVYTAIYKPREKQRAFWFELSKHKIVTSSINKFIFSKLQIKTTLPQQVQFFRHLDLEGYDLVISSSAGFAKFINVKKPKHIAYIHTPPRFLWGYDTSYFHKLPSTAKLVMKPTLKNWKKLDYEYARKADVILTNSKNIQNKIKECYNKESQVVYPPVQIDEILNFPKQQREDFYLTIGRLYDYKKIDLIVKAFAHTKKKLVIIGDGPQRKALQKIATDNIEIRGFVDENVKLELLKKAKGFVFAAEDDLGIVMVEALAAGTPVIAYGKGGAVEVVTNKKNGILFGEQTTEAIKQAISDFEGMEISSDNCEKSALKFSTKSFIDKITQAAKISI